MEGEYLVLGGFDSTVFYDDAIRSESVDSVGREGYSIAFREGDVDILVVGYLVVRDVESEVSGSALLVGSIGVFIVKHTDLTVGASEV